MSNIALLFTIGLITQTIATPVNIPLQNESDLLLKNALNSWTEESAKKYTYKKPVAVDDQGWLFGSQERTSDEGYSDLNQPIVCKLKHVQLLGGERSIKVDGPVIKDYVQKGLKKYSSDLLGANKPIVVEVVKATYQVTNALIYRINVKIGESNCPKGTALLENCLLVENTPVKDCWIRVSVRPPSIWEEITVRCDPPVVA